MSNTVKMIRAADKARRKGGMSSHRRSTFTKKVESDSILKSKEMEGVLW